MEALYYVRQGLELKFSLRITPYRGTRAVNVALRPADRLSTACSNSTYFRWQLDESRSWTEV